MYRNQQCINAFEIKIYKNKKAIYHYLYKNYSETRTMSKLTKSEEELGQKWDKCLQDTLIKTASGVGLGIVFSVVLFKSNFKIIYKISKL